MIYLCFSFVGAFCCLLKIPILSWIGMFFVFFANGLVYAATTKRVDATVNKTFSLTCLSIWLFIGDVGSVTGSNTWQFVDSWLCYENTSQYFCHG